MVLWTTTTSNSSNDFIMVLVKHKLSLQSCNIKWTVRCVPPAFGNPHEINLRSRSRRKDEKKTGCFWKIQMRINTETNATVLKFITSPLGCTVCHSVNSTTTYLIATQYRDGKSSPATWNEYLSVWQPNTFSLMRFMAIKSTSWTVCAVLMAILLLPSILAWDYIMPWITYVGNTKIREL